MRSHLPLLVLGFFLISCGTDEPTGPLSVASVEVAATTQTLTAFGQTVQLQATSKSVDGVTISGKTFTWESSAAAVVTITDSGLATAVGNGTATITAATDGVSGSLSVTVEQAASQLTIRTQPDGVSSGAPLTTQPVIELHDANGNVVSIDDTTVVSASLGAGGGTLGGGTSVTAVQGVAIFVDLTVSGLLGNHALSFAARNLPSITSDSFGLAGYNFNVSVTEVSGIKPLLFGLNVTVDPGAKVVVEYGTTGEPRLRVESAIGVDHELLLARLLPVANYDYEVQLTLLDTTIVAGSGSFVTDTLPTDLDNVVFTSTGESTSPLTMLELRVPTFQGFVAVDSKGRVVWYHRTSGSSWGWTKRANGNYVFLDTGDGLNEVMPTGEIVATLRRANAEVIHHDVIATPQNTLYFMSRHPQLVNETTWTGEIIWEWNPDTAELTERWNAFDFLSPDTDTTSRSTTDDWLHGNSLNIGPSGNVLLSSPWLNQVIAITEDFSAIAWRLGGKNATITTDSASVFDFQHAAAELSVGRVLVFDNRGGDDNGVPYSRALELDVNFTNNTATTAWSFRAPNGNYAAIISSARRMANGNTMVEFGPSDGLRGSVGPIEVYEVQQDGTIVWNLVVDGPDHMYRATPFDDIAGETEVGN